MLCYCSDFQKERIPESKFIFIDGTFDTAPEGFEQVLVILGQTKNMNLPISYILLPNKLYYTYSKALSLFMQETQCYFSNRTTFITDFEMAKIKAVKKNFMDNSHYLQYCYFHFCQSIIRHFQKYEKNDLINELISIAKLLPFINQELVYMVMDEFLQHEITDKFGKYFETNYLNKYDFNDWSVYNKPQQITITNNVAESHNRVLKDNIGHKPSLQKFEIIIQEIENNIYNKYESHSYTEPEVNRADEDTFKQKYRKFLTDLRRYEAGRRTTPDVEDRYFSELPFHEDQITLSNPIQLEEPILSTRIIEESLTTPNIEKTTTKISIKNLDTSAKKILEEKAQELSMEKARSPARRKIIKETFEELQKHETRIEFNQIKNWFNNNKSKF